MGGGLTLDNTSQQPPSKMAATSDTNAPTATETNGAADGETAAADDQKPYYGEANNTVVADNTTNTIEPTPPAQPAPPPKPKPNPFANIITLSSVAEGTTVKQIQTFFKPHRAIAVNNKKDDGTVDVAFKTRETCEAAMDKVGQDLNGSVPELTLNISE